MSPPGRNPQYGRLRLPPGASEELTVVLRNFRRQALHAEKLSLAHPESGKTVSWKSPLPADFTHLLETLRREYGESDPAEDGLETVYGDESGEEFPISSEPWDRR